MIIYSLMAQSINHMISVNRRIGMMCMARVSFKSFVVGKTGGRRWKALKKIKM
jgi:hypothetical protein